MQTISKNIFTLDLNSSKSVRTIYEIVSVEDLKANESFFRDIIFNEPEIVISPCIQAEIIDSEKWFGWATEVAVKTKDGSSAGRIDILLISESGRIGIFETKLMYNPESRRNVVVQLLEYALNLPNPDAYESILKDKPVR